MNSEQNRIALFASIMADAETKRDEQILAPILTDFMHDRELERGASWPVIINQEAIILYGRMEFLARHPRLPVFLGGSAVKLTSKYDQFTTPPLFPTEAEPFDDKLVTSAVQITIGRPQYSGSEHNKVAFVSNIISELNTGSVTKEPLYTVGFRLGSPNASAYIDGPDFTKKRIDAWSAAGLLDGDNWRDPTARAKVVDPIGDNIFQDICGKLMAVNRALSQRAAQPPARKHTTQN